MTPTDPPLQGRRIALPESRQLDLMATMLEKRGARILRCPLVAIRDTPDREPVLAWLTRCIDRPPDDLILLTGEGLRRLLGFAESAGRRTALVEAIPRMRVFARGPKPGQALKEIGLKPDVVARKPTTDGMIETLDELDMAGRRVGVQLYGEDPNRKLIDYLQRRGAHPDPVAPYVYASDSDADKVCALIDELAAGAVDAVAFTSQPQLKRLQSVARQHDRDAALKRGLDRVVVAAVGPVVAGALEQAGIRVDLVPETSFFMKPMVAKLERALS